MIFQFDEKLAKEIGVNGAIFVYKISIEHGEEFALSLNQLCKIFSFWSKMTLRTILKSLIDRKILIKNNPHEESINSTTMYKLNINMGVLELTHPYVRINTPPMLELTHPPLSLSKTEQKQLINYSVHLFYMLYWNYYMNIRNKKYIIPKKEKYKKERKVIGENTDNNSIFEICKKHKICGNNNKPIFAKIDLPNQILDYLNNQVYPTIRRSKFKPTAANLKFIRARIAEGATYDDCLHVIAVKCEEWLNTDMAKYLTPDTLFRPSNFEKYLSQKFRGEIKIEPRRNTQQKLLNDGLSSAGEWVEKNGGYEKLFNWD